MASWGFFFFFLVSAAFFGFAAVALAARAAVAFAGRVAVALAARVAVALAGRVAVALAGLVAVALAGLAAVAFVGRVAVAFAGTVRGAATGVGGATTVGAASAAAGAATNAMPICCSTFLRVEAGCTGVGFSPEVNASSSSAQASRIPAIGAQGHRLQVGVSFANRAAQKMQELKRDQPRRPVWAASDRSAHSRTGSVSSARVEDGTRGTARDQDAHAKSYGSISIEPKQNITDMGGGDEATGG